MTFVTLIGKNLFRRQSRSLLTILGIAIAVGTTVSLLGITEGFERSELETFEGRGADVVVTAAGKIDQLGSELRESYKQEMEALPGVHKVACALLDFTTVDNEGSSLSLVIQGWTPDSVNFEQLQFKQGAKFAETDGAICILGQTAADNLSKKPGDSIRIQGEDFKVVGVFESFSVYENGALIVPLKKLQSMMGREGTVTGFSITLKPEEKSKIDDVIASVVKMGELPNGKKELAASPTREYVNGSFQIKAAHAMAWLTSVIAVVVGAIGVLNTMIMSVVERTKEISVLRAIGWRRTNIIKMILGESVVLCVAGAAVGCFIAVAFIYTLTKLPQANGFIAGDVSPVVFAKGLLISLAVGVLGGAYPAYRASALEPTEGLRHE